MVRFVLRRGPFCPETWSVLSGPFYPWSVLSEYQPEVKPYKEEIGKGKNESSVHREYAELKSGRNNEPEREMRLRS